MSRREIDHLIDDVGLPQAAQARRVAAVLFTYRCSITCAHCLFGCAGDRPDKVMNPRQCADALGLLHETGRVVHIAGGEAMLYWDALAESVALAHREGNTPHFVETNGSFAATDEIVRERFQFLRAHGVKGLYASADPYHQAFVSPERILRVRRLAREIFGARNFYGPDVSDDAIRDFPALAADEARLGDYVRQHRPSMIGTAQQALARFLDAYAPDDPDLPTHTWGGGARAEANCRAQFAAETLWEIHIDPYDNIQTNCGMILGRVPATTPAALLAQGPETANRYVATVSSEGALGLARLAAREHGFALPARVTQTCELCYLTRRFLRAYDPEVFGPAEVYL